MMGSNGQLGEAVLHKTEADDETQWDGVDLFLHTQ
jgi:hypothetical protein